jgi:hypothetical protein
LPFFVRCWRSLRRRHFNMFSLFALSVGTAYLYGLVTTFARAFSRPGSAARTGWSKPQPSSPCWCYPDVLTIAHLDHTPENCAPHILRA